MYLLVGTELVQRYKVLKVEVCGTEKYQSVGDEVSNW